MEDGILPAELAAWQARGRRISTVAGNVFSLMEGPDGAEPLLILHGFPTASYDFHLALPLLSRSYRVVVHDHLGFGLSDKPDAYSYSLLEQADAAIEVWRTLGITEGHVLAHDYGTSVATELVARHLRGLLPIALRSLTLCNGSIHMELAHLTPAQRLLRNKTLGPLFARVANRRVFKAQMRRILGEPASIGESDLEMMWANIAHGGGRDRLARLTLYQDERVRFRDRWIGGLTRLDVPTHVLWGKRDPIAVPAIAEKLAGEIPGARLSWLEDLGHYPMLESPARWADGVLGFLETVRIAS
jgi:pimeloyl-ACP methyl ester carboxylesterase